MTSERHLEPRASLPAGYGPFLAAIKQQIRKRQYHALRAANHELLDLYWWLLRQFFARYSPKPNLQPMIREISWAKNLMVLVTRQKLQGPGYEF